MSPGIRARPTFRWFRRSRRPTAARRTLFSISKLSATGSTLVYSTYLGGSGMEYVETGRSIAVDSSGSAYVTGTTASANFPTFVPLQPSNNGSDDAFVVKLTPAGTAFVYSTYLGGSSVDYGESIAVDSSGYAYIGGYTASPDFPTLNADQTANGGGYDAFVSKLSPSGGVLVEGDFLGGSGNDAAYGIALDSAADAYLAGQTGSPNFPLKTPVESIDAGIQQRGFGREVHIRIGQSSYGRLGDANRRQRGKPDVHTAVPGFARRRRHRLGGDELERHAIDGGRVLPALYCREQHDRVGDKRGYRLGKRFHAGCRGNDAEQSVRPRSERLLGLLVGEQSHAQSGADFPAGFRRGEERLHAGAKRDGGPHPVAIAGNVDGYSGGASQRFRDTLLGLGLESDFQFHLQRSVRRRRYR